MLIQRALAAVSRYEYGCDLRRLYPWEGVAAPSWGAAIATVRPGESTIPHRHDELETFIVLSGSGRMTIEEQVETLVAGDVVLIPRNKGHCFANVSEVVPLSFITIFWDSPEARLRLEGLIAEKREDL